MVTVPRGAIMAEMRLREPVEPEPDHTGVGKVSFQTAPLRL